jgi:hypothetical protein
MMNYPDAPGVQSRDALLEDLLERAKSDGIDLANQPFGWIEAERIRDGKHGPEVIGRGLSHNLVVNQGKQQIWRIVSGLNTKVFDQMRIGTSPAAAASNQTGVLSPVTGTLVTVDFLSLESGTRTMQWLASYPSGVSSKSATGISEVALHNLNTSPGGSAMMRSTFTPVNKTESDKLRITYRARIT